MRPWSFFTLTALLAASSALAASPPAARYNHLYDDLCNAASSSGSLANRVWDITVAGRMTDFRHLNGGQVNSVRVYSRSEYSSIRAIAAFQASSNHINVNYDPVLKAYLGYSVLGGVVGQGAVGMQAVMVYPLLGSKGQEVGMSVCILSQVVPLLPVGARRPPALDPKYPRTVQLTDAEAAAKARKEAPALAAQAAADEKQSRRDGKILLGEQSRILEKAAALIPGFLIRRDAAWKALGSASDTLLARYAADEQVLEAGNLTPGFLKVCPRDPAERSDPHVMYLATRQLMVALGTDIDQNDGAGRPRDLADPVPLEGHPDLDAADQRVKNAVADTSAALSYLGQDLELYRSFMRTSPVSTMIRDGVPPYTESPVLSKTVLAGYDATLSDPDPDKAERPGLRAWRQRYWDLRLRLGRWTDAHPEIEEHREGPNYGCAGTDQN